MNASKSYAIPALASPRADSAEMTAGEDWAAVLAYSILTREGYAYEHLVNAVAAELRRIEAVGYSRGHEAGDAYRKATTPAPATPPGVPDSLRALSEAATAGPYNVSGVRKRYDEKSCVIVDAPSCPGLFAFATADGREALAALADAKFFVAAANYVRDVIAARTAGQEKLCSYIECAALGKSSCEDCRDGQAGDAGAVQCDRCQGNGEIVTDWQRYRHPLPGDVGDEATTDCPGCNGVGTVDAPAPNSTRTGAAETEEARRGELGRMVSTLRRLADSRVIVRVEDQDVVLGAADVLDEYQSEAAAIVECRGLRWSAWSEDDADSIATDPLVGYSTCWYVGVHTVEEPDPFFRIMVGSGKLSELMARKVAAALNDGAPCPALAARPEAPSDAGWREEGTNDNPTNALRNCAEAIAFFDQVKAASSAEQSAVGVDHWNWLEAACRRAGTCVAPPSDPAPSGQAEG